MSSVTNIALVRFLQRMHRARGILGGAADSLATANEKMKENVCNQRLINKHLAEVADRWKDRPIKKSVAKLSLIR